MNIKEIINRGNIKVLNIPLYSGIALIARITLGIVFIAAAIGKIPNIAQFENNVANYHMVPLAILPAFAFILPWIEILSGIYLVVGLFTRYTSYVVIALLLIFMIAIAYALITNQPVTGCGCFSQAPTERISWFDEVRDAFFLLLAFISLKTHNPLLSLDSYLKKRSINESDTRPSNI